MIDPSKPLDRFLMFIPGFISWLMLLVPIWLGLLWPEAASYILTFLAIYWVYMAIMSAYGLYKGYSAYKREIKENWYEKCLELDYSKLPNPETLPSKFEDLKHFILIPTVRETSDILDPVFKAIIDANYPKDRILIVVGTEEVGEEAVTNTLKEIKEKYGDKLPEIRHYIHPRGIPGEIVGVASPNRSWAARHAVEELKAEGKNIKDYIFTTFDSDTVIHKEFLPRIAYAYLVDEKRFNRFYETCVRFFHNNFWKVPLVSRIEASNITFGIMGRKQSSAYQAESFSCYSSALDTLVAANYWDVKFIDDTIFYWRAFLAREGDFSHKYFYIPISCDATDGINYVRAHINLFRQLVRWGWGSVSTVIALKYLFSKNLKKSTIEQKVIWLYTKFERHAIARTSVYLITFGFFFVTLVNQQFRNSATVYGLPQVISIFLTGGMFMLLPLTWIKKDLYPAPKGLPFWRRVLFFLEGPAVVINLLTYSFIPWLYAETLMMFGRLPKVTFYTPKVR